jgi:hypothetical protein
MKEDDVPMVKYAMHYGAILGLFWMFKYIFYIIAEFKFHIIGDITSDIFLYLYYVLNLGTFALIYVFYFKYKFAERDKPKEMGHCLLFTMTLCFFASFFEGAIAYAHYSFINPDYFNQIAQPLLKMADSLPETFPGYPQESIDVLHKIFSSKLYYVISLFMQNIIVGFFLGLILGIATRNIRNSNPS